MEFSAFDSETHAKIPGLVAPPIVCVTVQENDGRPRDVELLTRAEGLEWYHARLASHRKLVGANTAFDLCAACAADPSLLPLVFEAYERGDVYDILLDEQLINIALGVFKFEFDHEAGEWAKNDYNLEALALKYLSVRLDKGEDTWRTRYGELDGIPFADWPEDAREYAMGDTWVTRRVFQEQRAQVEKLIPEAVRIQQGRAAWALQLMGTWGIRTDPARVGEIRTKLEGEIAANRGALFEAGFYRFKHKVKRPSPLVKNLSIIRDRVSEAFKGAPPMSDPSGKFPAGQVKIDEETLIASGDPLLKILADVVMGNERLLSRFVPILELGTKVPINAWFHTLVSSGRTSCSGPPLQQLPRKGGIRECFIPRPGRLFVTSDYDTGELRTLAAITFKLFGYSRMRDALIRGEDLHLALAAAILGITYAEAVARLKAEDGAGEVTDVRQFAKIANFGFPGGMVAETLVDYAKQYGVTLTLAKAKELHAAWLRAWPEMVEYFRYINSLVGFGGEATFKSFGHPMLRGGVAYTDGCNHNFQNLMAQIAKEALWRVAWECYVGTVYRGAGAASPLAGSRPVVFMHDEIMIEAPSEQITAAGARLSKVLIEAAGTFIDSVPFTTAAAAMERWYKGAKAVWRDGKLLPWAPAQPKAKIEQGTPELISLLAS